MDRARKSSNLTRIGDILDKALNKYRPGSDIEMVRIWDHWETAVGSVVAKNAKPAAFKNETLIVSVSSSAWMHQLKFLEEEIVSNVNGCLEKPMVKHIRFKIAKLHH